MKRMTCCLALSLTIGFIACNQQSNKDLQKTKDAPMSNPTSKSMKSFLSIFEIPATEFSRATAFYQSILDIEIQEMEMQGMQMGLFPSDGQMVSGVVIKGEGYQPSTEGVTIYLNGGNNLQSILDRVEPSGGQVIVPKTLIDKENGYFALFIDTEGNKIGLHSPN